MKGVNNKSCFFYRNANGGSCAVKRKRCFWCPWHVPVIEGLEARDYVSLAVTNQSFRISTTIAFIAILVSIVALVFAIFG